MTLRTSHLSKMQPQVRQTLNLHYNNFPPWETDSPDSILTSTGALSDFTSIPTWSNGWGFHESFLPEHFVIVWCLGK